MPNIEIEHKYQVKDLEVIKKGLQKIGAKREGEKHVVDVYFEVPNNPEGRKYLRVRNKGGKSEISYSYAESESDTHGWETAVESKEMAEEIFLQLGFKHDVIVDKKRETYVYKNSEVVLDTVANLGSFVEIEAPNHKELSTIANELGLTEEARVKGMGYPDLIRGHLILN